MPYDVSDVEFQRLVREAIDQLPEQFRSALDEVPIEVRPRPTRQMLQGLGLGRNDLLLGLYQGVPLTERSIEAASGRMPDVIYLFKEDIEDASGSAEDLVEQVRITVLHEIGHHFGLGEEELERLGYR